MDVTYAVEAVEVLGRKLDATDIASDPRLGQLAVQYISQWTPSGNFTDEFMGSVLLAYNRWGNLSAAQAKGVLNVAVAAAKRPQASVAPTGPVQAAVADGRYTVVLGPEESDYVTLRLSESFLVRQGKAKPGAQMAAFLYGPSNTSDYKGFAFVDGSQVRVWGKFRDGYERQVQALTYLLGSDEETQWNAREMYAMQSGQCSRCGRDLTVPVSLHRGMGPVCFARFMGEDVEGEDE